MRIFKKSFLDKMGRRVCVNYEYELHLHLGTLQQHSSSQLMLEVPSLASMNHSTRQSSILQLQNPSDTLPYQTCLSKILLGKFAHTKDVYLLFIL